MSTLRPIVYVDPLGNDWPGVFIHGDEALGVASDLKAMASAIGRGDDAVIASAPAYLQRLAELLEACRK